MSSNAYNEPAAPPPVTFNEEEEAMLQEWTERVIAMLTANGED